MTALYVTEPYSLVKKDGDTLLVDIPANRELKREARKIRIPLIKVDQVVIVGDSTVTAQALAALLEQHAQITFLSPYGAFRGQIVPPNSRNSLLRLAQFRAHDDPARALALAKAFVAGKLANQRTLLLRSNRKLNDDAITQAAEALRGLMGQVEALESDGSPPADPSRPQAGSTWGSLLGLEGGGSARYFGVFGRLLRGDPVLTFEDRNRRPPRDPVNALLSYGYTLLLHQAVGALQTVGLDAYVGYLHSAQYSKPALALDLMEEFRAPVVDSTVLTLINNRILNSSDFKTELDVCRLTDAGRRTFLGKFEERMSTEIAHPVFGYKATYRRCLELQARLLAKNLLGEIDHYPPFKVR
ncbi:MAG: CRISPR-associated endonuclease Cas1 [Chloroflexi bacterium]|nr:CRISPR-associated endonuclease Cas1 [Chloroflexota bacterium]